MTRCSGEEWIGGRLMSGFDYIAQAWVVNGVYQPCGHPQAMREDGPCCNAWSLAGHPTRPQEATR
jgi:hypothetical protein